MSSNLSTERITNRARPAGLRWAIATLGLVTACAGVDAADDPAAPPLAQLAASARTTAELGVATWEVRADGAAVRVIGRDAGSARRVELVVHRDAAAPDERVQLEVIAPEPGELALTSDGVVEGAGSSYLRQLGADLHADLGRGATPVVTDGGIGSISSALAINSTGVIHLGWNLWSYTWAQTVGGPCRTGTIRHHGEIYGDQGAFAIWSGWAFSAPATDCTARFTMFMPAGHWDDFHWATLTSP